MPEKSQKRIGRPINQNSDRQLAIRVGISAMQLCGIIRGERCPRKKTAEKLEEATGIPASDWIFKQETLRKRLNELYPKEKTENPQEKAA